MSTITREAREGVMRAWLEILHERHPEVTLVAIRSNESLEDDPPADAEETIELVSAG